jgi:threonine aldolase
MPQQFASDNNAGLCPEALEALVRVNAAGHAPGYGDDAWTEQACARIRELFETDCAVFLRVQRDGSQRAGAGTVVQAL